MTEDKPGETYPEVFRVKGFGWRVGVSIFTVFGWFAFLIAWLFFYAGDYDIFQNIGVVLLSIIVGVGILAGIWATWGIRYASTHGGMHEPRMRMKSMRSSIISAVAGVGWLVFLVIWLFFYADDYSNYQNLAIFIASILVLCAVTGSTWFIHWMRTLRKPM